MKNNFWAKLSAQGKKKPIMAQAPMSGVTDQAFRLMLAKHGKPDIFWTEFVSADAVATKRAKKYWQAVLNFSKKERPIIAQIFGSDSGQITKACQIIEELGFDGVDINMGCPDRNVEKQGAGSSLIKNPELAKQIIRAAKAGVKKIPVSVKTRIGYDKNEIDTWIPHILKEGVAALTVHFRNKNQAYDVRANWDLAKKVVELRNRISPETLILGNGDVKTLEQAKDLAEKFGLDGVMIGRALIGNPWFFVGKVPSKADKLKAILEHSKILPAEKHWDSIKKHFHAYTKDFVGAKDLREALMKVKNKTETQKVVNNFKNNYKNDSKRSYK